MWCSNTIFELRSGAFTCNAAVHVTLKGTDSSATGHRTLSDDLGRAVITCCGYSEQWFWVFFQEVSITIGVAQQRQGSLLTELPNTVHSCSRRGVVAALPPSERSGSVTYSIYRSECNHSFSNWNGQNTLGVVCAVLPLLPSCVFTTAVSLFRRVTVRHLCNSILVSL